MACDWPIEICAMQRFEMEDAENRLVGEIACVVEAEKIYEKSAQRRARSVRHRHEG